VPLERYLSLEVILNDRMTFCVCGKDGNRILGDTGRQYFLRVSGKVFKRSQMWLIG
jgi:hypothetical protein